MSRMFEDEQKVEKDKIRKMKKGTESTERQYGTADSGRGMTSH